MWSRFLSNLSVLIVGSVLASARFVFGGETTRWLGFAAGVGVTLIVGVAFLVRGRGAIQRALDGCAIAIAGWTVVSTLTFPIPVVGWLSLGEGGAFIALTLAGLVAHEALMERPFRMEPGRTRRPDTPDGDGAAPPAGMPTPSWTG